MEAWHLSWETMDDWTDEIFNLFLLKRAGRLKQAKMEGAKANARASGNVMITDDEIAGKA